MTEVLVVFEQIATWIYGGVELHAPTLAQYEVINALTRLVVSKTLKAETAKKAWNDQSVLPIHYHSIYHPDPVIEIALSLKRQTAYDAAYLALAEELDTASGRSTDHSIAMPVSWDFQCGYSSEALK